MVNDQGNQLPSKNTNLNQKFKQGKLVLTKGMKQPLNRFDWKYSFQLISKKECVVTVLKEESEVQAWWCTSKGGGRAEDPGFKAILSYARIPDKRGLHETPSNKHMK